MSLSKLTDAPWEVDDTWLVHGRGEPWPDGKKRTLRETPGFIKCHEPADAVFCAMARNAFAGDPEALEWWEANRVRPLIVVGYDPSTKVATIDDGADEPMIAEK